MPFSGVRSAVRAWVRSTETAPKSRRFLPAPTSSDWYMFAAIRPPYSESSRPSPRASVACMKAGRASGGTLGEVSAPSPVRYLPTAAEKRQVPSRSSVGTAEKACV
ncbi:hypothetical protein D9M72_523780 [compost metagenome]